jgi:iron-regulated transporter 1
MDNNNGKSSNDKSRLHIDMDDSDHDNHNRMKRNGYDERYSLYVSYLFAAFGDRMWEFSSLIMLMTIFPSTLLWASLFGLAETAAGIIAGPYIGSFIDQRSRLIVVRVSIIGQNICISIACTIFYLLFLYQGTSTLSNALLYTAYTIVTLLAMIVKISSSINKVSLFKDWVPVLARADQDTVIDDTLRASRLTSLNTSMRRIDLMCSIIAPMAAGGFESLTSSSITAIAIGGWSLISTFIEWRLVYRAWINIPLVSSIGYVSLVRPYE